MLIQKRGSSMKSGYEILWTENAFKKTIGYLKENWNEKEIRKLFCLRGSFPQSV
jgi:hypothetical protein